MDECLCRSQIQDRFLTFKALAFAAQAKVRTNEAIWLSTFRLPTFNLRPHAFPQQLPGPAQPACPGDDPQQAVSPGLGMAPEALPDKDE